MTPEEEVIRAGRAREVLEHELFKEAVETVDAVYLQGIRSTGFTDEVSRSKFALRYACLHDVLTALRSFIETGEIAQEQMRQASLMERARKVVGFN
jgi:hypothetical protein